MAHVGRCTYHTLYTYEHTIQRIGSDKQCAKFCVTSEKGEVNFISSYVTMSLPPFRKYGHNLFKEMRMWGDSERRARERER